MLTRSTLHSRVRSVRVCYSLRRCPTDVFGVREPGVCVQPNTGDDHALRTSTMDATEQHTRFLTSNVHVHALFCPRCTCAERASSPVFGCTRTPGSRTPNTSVGQRRTE